jgi:hypothetical protein
MQEVKYYAPEIDEFFIGFEYEEYQQKEWNKLISPPKSLGYEWAKKVFNTSTSLGKIKSKLEKIRVKYLDKEDILECEFKFQCSDAFGQLIFKRGSFELTFYPPNPTFIEIDNSDKNFTRFIGRIKNKTELQKILKQLEIDGTN